MEDLNDKVTGSSLTAAEWNQVPSELQNVIEQTGQTLTNADLNQLGKGIAQYIGNGDFYTDSGAANAYVLTAIGTKQATTSYDDGMRIRFIPGNANTAASTVNVATLGVKDLVNFNSDALRGGELPANEITRAFYDLGNDRFQLTPEINATNYSVLKSGRKNAIINGDFDLWQRGTSSTSGVYLADRFGAQFSGSTGTQEQITFTLGQTDVPDEPRFHFRNTFTAGAGASDFVLVQHKIEGVRTFAGQTVTVSFYARSPTSLDFSVEFFQEFGTGGSPSSGVDQIGVKKFTLTPTFVRYTTVVSIPSISGKTLGTNENDTLILDFWFDAGSALDARTDSLGHQSGEIDVSHVQVELGAQATDFEILKKEQIINECERFFEKTYDLTVDPGTVTSNGRITEPATRNNATLTTGASFRVTKRATPTLTLYSPGTGASGMVENSGDKAGSIGLVSTKRIDQVTITGGTSAFSSAYQYTADSEL